MLGYKMKMHFYHEKEIKNNLLIDKFNDSRIHFFAFYSLYC